MFIFGIFIVFNNNNNNNNNNNDNDNNVLKGYRNESVVIW